MTVRTGAGRTSRRRVRTLAVTLALGALVLAGCDDDGDGGEETGPTAVLDEGTDGDVGGDDDGDGEAAPQTAAAAERPTEPMDLEVAVAGRSADQDGSTVSIEGGHAAFVLPSGNIACVMTEQTATCQIYDKTYTPDSAYLVPDLVGPCTVEEADAMRLVEESAAWTCAGEDLRAVAAVGAGGWWQDEVDGDTIEHEGQPLGVLPYGQRMQVGPVWCSSSDNGVTCGNPELGNRRIVMSRTSFAFDRNA